MSDRPEGKPRIPRPATKRGSKKDDGDAVSRSDRFAYESQKRSSWRGIGAAAIGGDREAIKKLAAIGTVLLDALANEGKATANPEVAEAARWLAGILSSIHAGQSPNDAFGYPQDAHRTAEYATLQKQVLIGQHFNGLRAQNEKYEVAKAIVAKQWNVSKSYAAECGKKLDNPKAPANSRKK